MKQAPFILLIVLTFLFFSNQASAQFDFVEKAKTAKVQGGVYDFKQFIN